MWQSRHSTSNGRYRPSPESISDTGADRRAQCIVEDLKACAENSQCVFYGKLLCYHANSDRWLMTTWIRALQTLSRVSRPPSMGGPPIEPPRNSFSAPSPFQPATPFGQVVGAFGSHPAAAQFTPSPAFGGPFQSSPAEAMPSAGPFTGELICPSRLLNLLPSRAVICERPMQGVVC